MLYARLCRALFVTARMRPMPRMIRLPVLLCLRPEDMFSWVCGYENLYVADVSRYPFSCNWLRERLKLVGMIDLFETIAV